MEMTHKTYVALSQIFRAGIYEDRLEYDVEDLRTSLPGVPAEELHAHLHRDDLFKLWKGTRHGFLLNLHVQFAERAFTLADAYDVYRVFHVTKQMDNWSEMTARNTLYRAVMLGVLKRVRRGVYQFVK